MTDLKLYHYSKDLYPDLRTLKARGIDPGEKTSPTLERFEPGGYDEHISFFLEPAPLDILGTIFKDTCHDFWYAGNKIYEYEVSVSKMPDFVYDIVESPLSNQLFYDPQYDNLSDVEWLKMLYDRKKAEGEVGYNKHEFLKVAPKYIGVLREEYLKLPKRENWERLKWKYAGAVVHVMIYPKGGIVKFDHCKKAVVGNKHVSLESLPLFTTW